MSDFWNSKTLKPPVINSFKCKSAIDINNVISILHDGIDTFTIPDALRLESSVMRRVIYRLKLQFRLDKGFKLFENTNRCLNNLLAFNITEDLTYLLDEVPKRYEKDLYFPSKQMLQYVLVRLQGYSQTSSRVVESAFQAAIFMKSRIRLGHQWEIAIVSYAVSSRIWQICKHLTTKCCLLFNELLPLLDKLELAGTKWLPDNYEFPKDLIDWLNYDWLVDKPDIILQLPLELPIFSLLDDDEEDVLYNGGYQLNKSKTIIINDSDDDGDDYFGNSKLVYNFHNLDQAAAKFFEPKNNAAPVTLTITDDESTKNTKSIDSCFSQKNFAKEKSKTKNKSTGLANMSGIIPLDSDDEVIQIDDSIVDENDVGETVSRKDFYQENEKKLKDKIVSETEMLSDKVNKTSSEEGTVCQNKFILDNSNISKDQIDNVEKIIYRQELVQENSLKHKHNINYVDDMLSNAENHSSDEGETIFQNEIIHEHANKLKNKIDDIGEIIYRKDLVLEHSKKLDDKVGTKADSLSDKKFKSFDEKEKVTQKNIVLKNAKKSKDKIDFNIKNDFKADDDIFSDEESVHSDIIKNSLTNCTVVDEESECKSDSDKCLDDESDVDVDILEDTQSKKLVPENESKTTECLQYSDDEFSGIFDTKEDINVMPPSTEIESSTYEIKKYSDARENSRKAKSVINKRDTEQNTEIPDSTKKKTKTKKLNMSIRLKGFHFKIVSAKDLQNFLDREERLRQSPRRLCFLDEEPKTKSGKRDKTCISSHLDDEKWSLLSMEIKYYIAMAMNSFVKKTVHINEAKEMLKEKLNPRDDESAKGENLDEVKQLINSFHTANQLEKYWIQINKFRMKKDRKKTGLYRDLNTDEWRDLGKVTKSSVKTARKIIEDSTNYIQQAKRLLKNVLDVKPENDNIENPNIKIRQRIRKNELNWTKEGRKYFIGSIKSLYDLKNFLDKESYLRKFFPKRCIFNYINDSTWANLSTRIKELIDMAHKQPIKRIIIIKAAKKLLKKPRRTKRPKLNCNDSNYVIDSDDNSDVEELRIKYKRKYEHIYNFLTDTSAKKKKYASSSVNEPNDLFDYVSNLESYEIPKIKGIQNITQRLEKEIKQAKKREKHKLLIEQNANKPMSNTRKRKLMLQEEEAYRKRLKSMFYYYY